MNDIDQLLEELKFEIGSTNSLKNNKNKILLGSGSFSGDILFVGDAPDLYIDEDFKVDVGSSGEFLIKLCDMLNLSPETYYITTVTKSEKKYRDLEEKEQKEMRDYLMAQISLMNPKLIVALGQDVAEMLLSREIKFLNERGKIETWRGDTKLLITYEINFAKQSRDIDGKRSKVALEFWEDLKSIKTE